LTSGSTYFAIRITAQTVQLAQTYCDARGISKGANGVCDSSPSVPHGGDDGLPGSAPVVHIGLTPNKTDFAYLRVVHSLSRANDAPIANLQDEHGYYVVGCGGPCSSFFQLSNTMGGSAIAIDNGGRTGGPHVFQTEGPDLTSTGSNDQQLVID